MLRAFIAVINPFRANQFWQQTDVYLQSRLIIKQSQVSALSVRWKYHSGTLLCAAHSALEQQY